MMKPEEDIGIVAWSLGFLVTIAAAVTGWFSSRLDKKASKEALQRVEDRVDEKVDKDVLAEYKNHNDVMHGITHSSLKEIKSALAGKQDK